QRSSGVHRVDCTWLRCREAGTATGYGHRDECCQRNDFHLSSMFITVRVTRTRSLPRVHARTIRTPLQYVSAVLNCSTRLRGVIAGCKRRTATRNSPKLKSDTIRDGCGSSVPPKTPKICWMSWVLRSHST